MKEKIKLFFSKENLKEKMSKPGFGVVAGLAVLVGSFSTEACWGGAILLFVYFILWMRQS